MKVTIYTNPGLESLYQEKLACLKTNRPYNPGAFRKSNPVVKYAKRVRRAAKVAYKIVRHG